MTETLETAPIVIETAPAKRGRGRPAVYTDDQRDIFAALIEDRGVSGTRDVLNSRNGVVGITKVEQERARLRKQLGWDKPVGISMPTLLTVAKRRGISLKRGRRVSVTA